MKKILAFTLTSILLLGGSGAAIAASATTASPEVPKAEATTQSKLYLVPGTYVSGGETVKNDIPSGATALTDDECAEIYTDNAYVCTLGKGAALPAPESQRKDAEGNLYTFNGWWTIVDATVTYFETVPEISETTFLYADWRADLSQRKDPVEPDESTTVQPRYYMSIVRAETGKTETVTLLVSGTDVSNAENLGYSAPVQLYNDWFELNPGDEITVFTAGLGGSEEVQQAPLATGDAKGEITLENSANEHNDTKDYLENAAGTLKLTYKQSQSSRHFRIYIKFYNGGSTMTVYMQPQE